MAAFLALLAGGAGLFSSLQTEQPPARPGEAVAAVGGLMRVDGVTPEHMAPMKAGKFSATGMNMAATGMDMAPDGARRFSVDVTLAAGDQSSLAYSAEDFSISGDGVEGAAPIRHQLESGILPAGATISGSLVFQVPEEAEKLLLSYKNERPVALHLSPAQPGPAHGGHGGAQQKEHSH